jgi:hypothetical protein
MRDQYGGDVSDVLKFALLRQAGSHRTLAIEGASHHAPATHDINLEFLRANCIALVPAENSDMSPIPRDHETNMAAAASGKRSGHDNRPVLRALQTLSVVQPVGSSC